MTDAVRSEISAFFRREAHLARRYGREFTELWRLAHRQMEGGKLLRPRLFLDTFSALRDGALEAPPHRDVLQIAVAIELLHFAFLLHDDVIDADVRRRGGPNLIAALRTELDEAAEGPRHRGKGHLDSLHWGRSGAILMGDLMLSAAHQVMARANLLHSTRLTLLDALADTIRETVAGEQLDVGLSDGIIEPGLAVVRAMSAYKTASYTFEFPMRAAAILAHTPREAVRSLSRIGRHLGLAFQLQDDLLSVFGDPSVHGKDPFSDLREGKQTAMICFARGTAAWQDIETDFGDPHLTLEQGMRLRSLLEGCGARATMQQMIDHELAAAQHLLADGNSAVPNCLRPQLGAHLDKLRGRTA